MDDKPHIKMVDTFNEMVDALPIPLREQVLIACENYSHIVINALVNLAAIQGAALEKAAIMNFEDHIRKIPNHQKLYIFEDGNYSQTSEKITEEDVACVKDGILSILRYKDGVFEFLDDEDSWIAVDKHERE